MKQAIHDFPDHLAEAQKLCQGFTLASKTVNKIVIFGMGGSAIGGDLAGAVCDQAGALPVHVIRNEVIPHWIDEQTFVIAVSYSGNTQETLSAFESALARRPNGAAVITTGGKLKAIAGSRNIPCLEIPGGLMPRAGLAFTFVPILHFVSQIAKLPAQAFNLTDAIEVLKQMRDKLSASNSDAQSLAKSIHGKFPLIYAPTPAFMPAARRWKCQINENAKQPAAFEVFPELCHNEIVGFTQSLPIHKSLAAILLRDDEEPSNVRKRIDTTRDILKESGTFLHEITSQGKTFLSRLLSFCYDADWVSLYLAEENKVDPIPIAVIDRLKAEMEPGFSKK